MAIPTFRHFINGQYVESTASELFDLVSPVDGQVYGRSTILVSSGENTTTFTIPIKSLILLIGLAVLPPTRPPGSYRAGS